MARHRPRRHAPGHHQLPGPQFLPPVVDLPPRRPVPPRDIRHRHPGHQALRRNPPPLRLRAPPSPGRPLDHLQPRNPTATEPSRWTPALPSLSKAHTSNAHAHGGCPSQITRGRRGTAQRLRSMPCKDRATLVRGRPPRGPRSLADPLRMRAGRCLVRHTAPTPAWRPCYAQGRRPERTWPIVSASAPAARVPTAGS